MISLCKKVDITPKFNIISNIIIFFLKLFYVIIR